MWSLLGPLSFTKHLSLPTLTHSLAFRLHASPLTFLFLTSSSLFHLPLSHMFLSQTSSWSAAVPLFPFSISRFTAFTSLSLALALYLSLPDSLVLKQRVDTVRCGSLTTDDYRTDLA